MHTPIKWTGSKQKLTSWIIEKFPSKFNTYYEPFFGSGAVFFDLEPKNSVCSDVQTEPIVVMNSLKSNIEDVLFQLKILSENLFIQGEPYYYSVRQEYNKNKNLFDDSKRAAYFMFLLKSCFNGVVRFNTKKDNAWNVPFGQRYSENTTNTHLLDESYQKNLNQISLFLNTINTNFINCSYQESIEKSVEGDLIYCDPPYLFAGEHYNGSWNLEHEISLSEKLKAADNRGVKFVLSNVYTYNEKTNDQLMSLYSNFKYELKDHNYIIGSNAKARKKIEEIIIYN